MVCIVAMVSTSLSAQSVVPKDFDNQDDSLAYAAENNKDGGVSNTKDFNGTYYLNIPATGANSIFTADEYSYTSAGCVYFDDVGFMETNIHIPDGHRINGIRYYYRDGDAENSSASIYRAPSGGSFSTIVTNVSDGETGTYVSRYESAPTAHFVNNASNAYVVRFTASTTGTGQQMCGARINITKGLKIPPVKCMLCTHRANKL